MVQDRQADDGVEGPAVCHRLAQSASAEIGQGTQGAAGPQPLRLLAGQGQQLLVGIDARVVATDAGLGQRAGEAPVAAAHVQEAQRARRE